MPKNLQDMTLAEQVDWVAGDLQVADDDPTTCYEWLTKHRVKFIHPVGADFTIHLLNDGSMGFFDTLNKLEGKLGNYIPFRVVVNAERIPDNDQSV